jgi:hypothetical protein
VDVQGIEGDDTGSCNDCHDALGPTFHDGQYGGNINVCRLCHDSLDDGSHLEMQSRAIDSYVHAIHTFQAFDIGDIDFTDPAETAKFVVDSEHFFPRFTRKACEACHVMKGTGEAQYTVPNQAKSLAARLSASDTMDPVTGLERGIGTVPSYVTGPAYRSCGGCHRAELIRDDGLAAVGSIGENDAAGRLVSLNAHAKQNGYLVEVDDDNADSILETVIDRIQSFFN